jgi:ubiquinone/menaquinone biosynthesis C-methylase UbiE
MSQKEVFLSEEGDAYFNRNRTGTDLHHDLIASSLRRLQATPKRILEIGCSDGHRLRALRDAFGSECHGIDPSSQAINANKWQDIHLKLGTADKLDFADGHFDFVLFGFCLYLCDPRDHFAIAAEATRVLADGGLLAISDFCPNRAYRNPYAHRPGLFSYKMEYSRMFTWHPGYRLLSRSYYEHAEQYHYSADEAAAVDILLKDFANAFPAK